MLLSEYNFTRSLYMETTGTKLTHLAKKANEGGVGRRILETLVLAIISLIEVKSVWPCSSPFLYSGGLFQVITKYDIATASHISKVDNSFCKTILEYHHIVLQRNPSNPKFMEILPSFYGSWKTHAKWKKLIYLAIITTNNDSERRQKRKYI